MFGTTSSQGSAYLGDQGFAVGELLPMTANDVPACSAEALVSNLVVDPLFVIVMVRSIGFDEEFDAGDGKVRNIACDGILLDNAEPVTLTERIDGIADVERERAFETGLILTEGFGSLAEERFAQGFLDCRMKSFLYRRLHLHRSFRT